jgi:fatty acid desaturase
MHLGDQRKNHLIHHRSLGTEEDPDRYLHVAANKASFARYLFFLSGLMTFPHTVSKVARTKSEGSFVSRMVAFAWSRRWMLGWQAFIFGMMLWQFEWWYYFVFWIAPIYVHVFVADEIRAFSEHSQPVVPDTAVDDKRLITYVPNRLERWLFAPMNMNYHAEHHLWIYVPYYNIPKLHAYLANRPEIEVRRSYLAYLWRYLRMLPLGPDAAAAARAA